MASENEIEALVYRLVGDGSEYQKMINQAARSTEDAAKKVEEAGHKIEGFQHKLEGFAHRAEHVLGMVGVTIGLKEALEKFEAAEKGAIRLDAVIRANGENVEATVKDYKKFANEMLNSSAVSRQTTLNLAKMAETFDLTGAAAKRAVKESLAVAAVNEDSAESMMRLVAAVAKGDTERAMMFARMIPQLRGVKDESEFMERYNKLVEAGTRIMEEEAKTVGGTMEKLKASTGAVTKDLGKLVAEGLEPVMHKLQGATEWFNKLDKSTREEIVGGLALIAVIGPLGGLIAKLSISAAASVLTLNNLKVAAAGAALYGLKLLSDAITGAKDRAEMMAKVSASIAAAGERDKSSASDRFSKIMGIEDPEVRLKALQNEKEYMEKLVKYREDVVKYRGKETAGKDVGIRHVPILGEAFDEDYKVATLRLENLKGLLETARTMRTKVEAELKKAFTGPAGPGLIGKGLGALSPALKIAKDMAEANIEGKELAKTLKEDIDTFGMSAEDAKIYKLALRGLNEETLNNIRMLSDQKMRMEEHAEALKKGADIVREMRTPWEKHDERVNELNEALKEGAISQEVYNRALRDANDTLDEMVNKTEKLRNEMQRFDATLSGGAEAKSRIAAYMDAISAPVKAAEKQPWWRFAKDKVMVPSSGMYGAGGDFDAGGGAPFEGIGFGGAYAVPRLPTSFAPDPVKDKIVALVGAIAANIALMKDKPPIILDVVDLGP